MTFHHIHRRKRLHVNHELYPHPEPWKRLLDNILLVLAGLTPLTSIPQLLKVFLEKDSDLSLLSWSLYTIFCIPWILYGMTHKDKLIVFAYSANLGIHILIVYGILIYG